MDRDKEIDVEAAHGFSIHNRKQLEKSNMCGCFECVKIFTPSEIEEYIEEEPDDTAICPYCGIDAVIGESSGYPMTEDFMKRMHRRWIESGIGEKIISPFGTIKVFLDDEPLWFLYRSIDPVDGLFPDADATYRISVDVDLDGKEHLLKMQLCDCEVSGDPESGERLEAISFYSGKGKITLGCYASFGDYEDYDFDYDGCLCPDGIEVGIFPSTKTHTFKFGICWLNECTEENDVQTWFGADSGICGI